ncbi:hypothetical protein OG21DRAFT_1483374 [Imleria badia]|nr:hypothetical protein OG21DRAFT_1483374 [Imleria badia]
MQGKHYHSSKRLLLGNQAGQVPPAWREQKQKDSGSKILLSRLPPDELFRKTVGPLKEVFLIYNSQGRSKGMAVVSFQRAGDAALARSKYDGKFIDGRRPIKIEIVVDSEHAAVSPPQQTQPSLLGRLGGITNPLLSITPHNHAPNAPARKQRPVSSAPLAVAPRRRQKKGPRRVKKTLAQLDQEMEDYRASFAVNGK